MANQQGKKTQSAQNTGSTPGTSTGNQGTSAVPASGQDRPQPTAAGSPTAGQPTQSASSSTGSSPGMTGTGTSNTGDGGIGEKLSSTTSGIFDKAKETASDTYDAVATKATDRIQERKGELSTGLKTLADTFRKTGSDLQNAPQTSSLTDFTAKYTGSAASQIEKVANYFERKDPREMMRDAESFARRNPAIFLGAAFALGMLAARFLKSSSPDRQNDSRFSGSNVGMPSTSGSSLDRPSSMPTNP
jgi:hypothetical protein